MRLGRVGKGSAGTRRAHTFSSFPLGNMRSFQNRYICTNMSALPLPLAAGSGGAYLHSGVNVGLERCTFVENQAGEEGPAVLSLGIAENVSDVAFDSNTLYCRSGTYGYEMDASDPEVRHTITLNPP